MSRCSTVSRDLEEPAAGTASTVRAFVLLEAAGPWGVDAVRDVRMDEDVRRLLLDLERRHRVRPLLVRRHGRSVDGPRRLFAVSAGRTATGTAGAGDGTRAEAPAGTAAGTPAGTAAGTPALPAAGTPAETAARTGPWAETAVLDDVRELLDVDLTGLADGRSPGLAPHHDPLFLVCTHGRHDACCAERGRPLAAAMAEVAPQETWEVSHIGGDRFAANVLVLPDGLYYGRVSPSAAAALVATHRAGRLDLAHLRGRSSYPFAVQAAEVHLRRETGADKISAVRLERARREGAVTRAVFGSATGRWEVSVRTEPGEPRLLTCRAATASPALVHTVEGIRRLP